MNAAHWHMMLNYFPVIGLLLGFLLWGFACKMKRPELDRLLGHTFYTLVNGKRADVGIKGKPPNEYLQTHADGCWSINLEALDACRY